jgi:hypothetical protein
LAGFEATVRLVDDVNATLAAHDTVIAVAGTQGFQRVAHFHDRHFHWWGVPGPLWTGKPENWLHYLQTGCLEAQKTRYRPSSGLGGR